MSNKRSRKKSEVWSYYDIIADAPHLAKCRLCSSKIARGKADAAKKSYSVKGLWDHLSAKHKEEFKKAKASQEEYLTKKQKLEEEFTAKKSQLYQLEQPTLAAIVERNVKWSNESPNQIHAERLLLNWMFDDLQPYTVVESEQFQIFVNNLNRKFQIPSEKVIRCTLMPKLYKQTQFKLLKSLSETLKDGYFSVTCDVWSSQALDSYLGVTIHFIDEDFQRKVIIIRCLPYNTNHSGESIQNRVKYILEK